MTLLLLTLSSSDFSAYEELLSRSLALDTISTWHSITFPVLNSKAVASEEYAHKNPCVIALDSEKEKDSSLILRTTESTFYLLTSAPEHFYSFTVTVAAATCPLMNNATQY